MRNTIATYTGRKLEPAIYPECAHTLAVNLQPAETDTVEYAQGTLMGRVTDGGAYAAYDPAGADGREVAVGFLTEACSVDVNGMIGKTTTPGASGDWGERFSTASIYISGYLFGVDLPQTGDTGVLDTGAIENLNGRWIWGDLTEGLFKF